MKITWLSNAPWAQTGYGTQTRVNVPRIKAAGHDIQVAALYGLSGGILNWNNIPVFPGAYHPYGQDIISAHSAGSDIMISLMDAWVCEPEHYAPFVRWCAWFPIDSDPLPPPVRVKVQQAYHRIVMSKFGARMMDNAGITDYSYIPHGIDTKVFIPVDRVEARKKVELPADAFVVGMVAANKGNPSRKAFTQQIEAFAEFKKTRKEAVLYIHTCKGEHGEAGGVNLPEFCAYYGLQLDKDVFFPDQYQYLVGFPDDWMNLLYNSFDVLLSVSMGEGFGIPIVEAQAAGCPVIVGDWTSMSELCFSGWKVAKSDAEPVWTALGTYQFSPHASAVLDKLNAAYRKKDNLKYRIAARLGAEDYDADKIFTENWIPTLKLIADKISNEQPKHVHTWGKIGLYDHSGRLSVPCLTCDDELIPSTREIIKDGFKLSFPLTFVPDNDGVTKIVCREIERDYHLDGLDIKPGDVIIDIGAHKGIVSCYLAWKYPQARILAYEPTRENYVDLIANIAKNNLTNVYPEKLAVTADGRQVTITTSKDNSGGSNIYGDDSGETVSSTTLVDIISSSFARVALLKIDCEGAEYEILQSMDFNLSYINSLRGEFHRAHGDADALLEYVKTRIPDVIVTVQG